MISIFSTCPIIPWIHDFRYELTTHRKFQEKENKIFSMLPEHVREKIPENDEYLSSKQIRDAITTGIPDEIERAVLVFKILGLQDLMILYGDNGWTLSCLKILSGIPTSRLIEATMKVRDDPLALKGASWWFFKHLIRVVGIEGETIDEDDLKQALPLVTSFAMSNWSRMNRDIAITTLGKYGGYTGRELLRQILNGQIEVKPISVDPQLFLPKTPPEKRCSASAYAALTLAHIGDKDSLPQILMLSEKAEGDDKEVYDKAIAILQES